MHLQIGRAVKPTHRYCITFCTFCSFIAIVVLNLDLPAQVSFLEWKHFLERYGPIEFCWEKVSCLFVA
jgi:hypothetical protein